MAAVLLLIGSKLEEPELVTELFLGSGCVAPQLPLVGHLKAGF